MFRKCIPIALFFQTLNLFGITDTWTGTSSADWGTPGNWQSMTVPGTTLGGGDVAILSGAMNNIILLGMPMPAVRTLGELDLNLGAGYTINPAGGSFAFQVSTGGSAQLNVNDGPNVINANINLLSPLILTQSSTSLFQIHGVLSGSQNLTTEGTGTTQLTANNSGYTGLVTIDAGTLSVGMDNSLGDTSKALTIHNGILLFTATASPSRSISLTGNAGINVNPIASILTLTGVLSGAGSLTKGDVGTLVLTAANTYQGGTTISGGILSISSDGNLGNSAGSLNIGNGQLTITAPISTARSGTISGNAIIQSGATNTFSGNFSGAGNLTVQGGGTFVFVGTNSYSGGTFVAANTHLSGTTNGLQGNITLSAPTSQVTFSQNFDGTYAGAISNPMGGGLVTKVGSGTVTFTGTSPYTGPTQINQGTLAVNGSLASSSVTIQGGTLSGFGTVGPTTVGGPPINFGIIDPGQGSTVGTLTINGMLTYGLGGQTNINIAPLASDKIAVLGAATISGALQIAPIPGFYGFSANYTILTSTGLAGTFGPITSTNPAFAPTATYTATDVILDIVISAPFAVFPFSNPNTAAVGHNIDALYAADQLSQDLLNIFNSFIGQSNATINAALDQMHPAPYSAFTEMQTEVNSQLISLFHRLPYLPCSCNNPSRLWVEGLGNTLTMKKHGLEIGFQANTGGLAFGFDGQINEYFVLGAGGAWTRNSLEWHDHRGKGDVTGLYGGFYFDTQVDGFYVGGSCLAGMDFYDTDRHMEFVATDRHAHADFQAFDITSQLALAYLFGSPQAYFYPYANIDYLYLHTHKFSEEGAGGLDLNVFARTDSTLRSELGLGLQIQDRNAAETMCVSPLVSIGWVNMYPLQRPKLQATFAGGSIPFSVIGWDESWNLFNVNFELSVAYRCYSLMIGYNAEFSPDSHTILFNQHGNLRLDWKW